MKGSALLFWVIAVFFFLTAVLYTAWGWLDKGEIDWSGGTPLGLVALFAALVAFYLTQSYRSQGGQLPEDRNDANVDDGDPEIGHFSPWSWWPVLLGAGAALVVLGLAIGIWICFIGVAFSLICLIGWTYEYYRGYFSR